MKLAFALCGHLVKGREESEAMLQVLSVNSQAEDFKALDIDTQVEDLDIEDLANHSSLSSMFDFDFDMEESGDPPGIDGFDWVAVEGAKCFKGETAGFYKSTGGDPAKLVIYLQGGGGCFNPRPGGDCSKRPADRFVVAPEQPFPGLIDEGTEVFGEFTRVYVPYCTQDLWAGNHPKFFTGQANLRKFIPNMVDPGGVKEVLLAGTSAGGIGTFLNCNLVESLYPNAATKCAAIDGFFFPFGKAEAKFKQAFAGYKAEDASKGPFSIVDDLVKEGKVFVANAMFDPTQMLMMKKVSHGDVKTASQAIMQRAEDPFADTPQLKKFSQVFGRAMVHSLSKKVPATSDAGLFLMACFNHAKSSKPGRVCKTAGGEETPIKVGGQSVLDALTAWYTGEKVNVVDKGDIDNLNPTCPRPGKCDKRVIR